MTHDHSNDRYLALRALKTKIVAHIHFFLDIVPEMEVLFQLFVGKMTSEPQYKKKAFLRIVLPLLRAPNESVDVSGSRCDY